MESTLSVHRQRKLTKKMEYTYTIEYYAAIKKNDKAVHSNTDDSREVINTEHSKSDREGETHDIRYMWNLKRNNINELIYKAERESQT